jgi:hypothetical protein
MALRRKQQHIDSYKSKVLASFAANLTERLENKVREYSKEANKTYKTFSAISNRGAALATINPIWHSAIDEAAHCAIGEDITECEDKTREMQMKQALKALVAY